MTLYELLFIVLFLATVAAAAGVLVLAATRRRASAAKVLLTTVAVWSIYLAILAISDAAARQVVIRPGEDHCFDEMCFAVVDNQTSFSLTQPDHTTWVVTVRATSHSRGRTQAEGGLRARLYANGMFFNVSEQAQKEYESAHGKTPPLTQRLAPGESIQSVLVFDLPRSMTHPGLALDHGFTPGYFVIGESPFFHEPDILQLPKDS